MSHSNGQIYISAPYGVCIEDIRSVIGAASTDLGTLCRSALVNPWAKCKPFVYPAWGFASAAATLTARQSKNCGLVMRDYGSLWNVYSSMIAAGEGAGGWKWDYPGGTSTSPYRMLDFNGYDHSAAAPLQVGIYPNPAFKIDSPRLSDEGGAGTADIQLSDLQGDNTNALNHSNYKYHSISSLYLGVAYGTGTTSPAHAYTLGPVSSYTAQYIPKPGSTGTYYVVPFLSDQQLVGDDPTSRSGVFIPTPIGMSIWNYSNTLGVSYSGCELNAARNGLDMYLASVNGTRSYYKLTVLVYENGTVSNSIDLNSGSSGQLTTSTTSFGTLTLNPAASQNATYFLRYWTTSVNYYDEQFYPMETPVE